MKSFTMANFVKADQLPDGPPTLLDLVPSVVYDMPDMIEHIKAAHQMAAR